MAYISLAAGLLLPVEQIFDWTTWELQFHIFYKSLWGTKIVLDLYLLILFPHKFCKNNKYHYYKILQKIYNWCCHFTCLTLSLKHPNWPNVKIKYGMINLRADSPPPPFFFLHVTKLHYLTLRGWWWCFFLNISLDFM